MRVVGGRLKGRNLAVAVVARYPPDCGSVARVVFNILIHAYDDPITARACSTCSPAPARSASRRFARRAFALFVDNGAEARALLRNNVEALGLGGVTKVYRRDATNLGPAHPVEPFSLVFLDPPYARSWLRKRWPRCAMAAG